MIDWTRGALGLCVTTSLRASTAAHSFPFQYDTGKASKVFRGHFFPRPFFFFSQKKIKKDLKHQRFHAKRLGSAFFTRPAAARLAVISNTVRIGGFLSAAEAPWDPKKERKEETKRGGVSG